MINKSNLAKYFESSYEKLIYEIQENVDGKVLSTLNDKVYVLENDKIYSYNYKIENGQVNLSNRTLCDDLVIESKEYYKQLVESISDKIIKGEDLNEAEIRDFCSLAITPKVLIESIDRDRLWVKEYKKNKSNIENKVIKQEEPKKVKKETGGVVDDFKKLHEKIKHIMDDIVGIYSLYGEKELKESISPIEGYAKLILEDISDDLLYIKKSLEVLKELDYNDYMLLESRINMAGNFVNFICK